MALTTTIAVRVTEHEKKNIMWASELEGRSMSNYIMNCVRADIKRKKLAETNRAKRLKKYAEYTPDISTYDLDFTDLQNLDDDKFM